MATTEAETVSEGAPAARDTPAARDPASRDRGRREIGPRQRRPPKEVAVKIEDVVVGQTYQGVVVSLQHIQMHLISKICFYLLVQGVDLWALCLSFAETCYRLWSLRGHWVQH